MGGADRAALEAVRDYWNRRPCNSGHSRLERGSAAYFNQVEQRKYFVEPHLARFADFPAWSGKRVLEIGCGIGTETINFARAGAHVTAVDLSPESLKLAHRRAEIFNVGYRINFVEADVEHLSSLVEVEPYDLVWSWGVFHHTPDSKRALVEAARFMGRGSEMRFMVYARNSWKAAAIEAGVDQFEAQAGCPVARTFRQDEIRDMVQSIVHATLSMEQTHLFPYDVGAYIAGEYRLAPWFQSMPPALFQQLEKRFGWHLMVRVMS